MRAHGEHVQTWEGKSKIDRVEPPTPVSEITRTWREALRVCRNHAWEAFPTSCNERFRKLAAEMQKGRSLMLALGKSVRSRGGQIRREEERSAAVKRLSS